MGRVARLLGPISLALLAAACGEEVDFSSGGQGPAAMGPDASAQLDAAPFESNDGSTFAKGPRDARSAADARCPPPSAGAAFACRENGSICRTSDDCCSGRCEQGYCLQAGTCDAPGTPCSTRNGCCSHRCDPSGRSNELACDQFCMADGAHCTGARDCCSLACNSGTCGGPMCLTAGTPCSGDASCCSGRCEPNGCAEPDSICLPSGEGCGQDGGVKCCSGVCNKTGRCDLGKGGPCREASTPCVLDTDCCLGRCLRNPQDPRGETVCTAACLADGMDCNTNGDCCGRVCTGLATRCMTPVPGCP